jgi:glycerate 2-kinase
MKILIAPDKFKGSLTAIEVCNAIAEGIHLVDTEIEIIKLPLADGGEGTAEILTYHTKGKTVTKTVNDPLMRPVEASFGMSGDGQTAFIEMAVASGLYLLKQEERNCLYTTTYGTGELILAALQEGAQKIILGIGGSATNDCGMGMAAALGYKFLDSTGKELEPVGENLQYVAEITDSALKFNPDEVEVKIACDVDNPLYGENGAAWIYGPQKGADEEAIKVLDQGLRKINKVFQEQYGVDANAIQGAGAAGGLGAGGILFLGASLVPGVQLIMQLVNFEEMTKGVDLIITGEGKIDRQTMRGKVVKGVSDIGKHHQIPVAALCGTFEGATALIKDLGLAFVASIISKPETLEEATHHAHEGLKNLSFSLLRFYKTVRGIH